MSNTALISITLVILVFIMPWPLALTAPTTHDPHFRFRFCLRIPQSLNPESPHPAY